mgnify:FL=1
MAVFTLTQDFYGHGFKLGSTWTFQFTRKAGLTPDLVDVTGLTTRVMFREGGVDGTVVLTVENANITNGGAAGTVGFALTATQTSLFLPATWYYFDVEMAAVGGHVWQSPTMRFRTEQEVTRP